MIFTVTATDSRPVSPALVPSVTVYSAHNNTLLDAPKLCIRAEVLGFLVSKHVKKAFVTFQLLILFLNNSDNF